MVHGDFWIIDETSSFLSMFVLLSALQFRFFAGYLKMASQKVKTLLSLVRFVLEKVLSPEFSELNKVERTLDTPMIVSGET